MLILTRTVRLPRTQQTPGTLSSVFHPKGFTSPPLTSAGEGGAGVGPVPAKRPLGPAAGCCSCQPGLQSTWGSSSANHRQELGLSALIAGLRLSLSTFKPPQPVGHPGPFLMGHLCGLIGTSSEGHCPHGSKGEFLVLAVSPPCRARPLLMQEDTASSL